MTRLPSVWPDTIGLAVHANAGSQVGNVVASLLAAAVLVLDCWWIAPPCPSSGPSCDQQVILTQSTIDHTVAWIEQQQARPNLLIEPLCSNGTERANGT
jgi:hypothetical protein